MRAISQVVVVLAALLIVAIFVLLGDGERVTPYGQGLVELEVGELEAFALPDYAEAVMCVIDVVQKNRRDALQTPFGSFAHWSEYLLGTDKAKITGLVRGVARSSGFLVMRRLRWQLSALP